MSSPPSIIGRPYQAIHAYNKNVPNTITLAKGDRGKVVAEHRGDGLVCVTRGRTGQIGWVEQGYIQVDMRPLKIRHNVQPLLVESSEIPPNLRSHTGHVLFNTLDALMLALRQNRDRFTFIEPRWLHILSDDGQCNALMSAIKLGMNQNFINIVHDPTSTIYDFERTMQPIGNENNNAGVYFRVTESFRADPSRKPEAYVGQTADFARRMREHTGAPERGSNSARVRSQREASKIRVYEICRLPPNNNLWLNYAEQFLILVTQSYLKAVKQMAMPVAEIDDADNAEVEILKTYDDKLAGAVLSNLANKVFQETGLSAMVDRWSFECHDGLNYQSPLTEYSLHEKKLWIRTIQPGVKAAFHRTGMTLVQVSNSSALSANVLRSPPSTGQNHHLDANVYVGEPGPPVGTIVYPVVEIMINGEEHHTPWARLGPLGPWRDWNRANSLGLRIEWDDQGRRYQRYCQASSIWNWLGSYEEPGSFTTYAQAIGLILFFESMTAMSPRRWYANFGLPRMKELRMDFQNNELRLDDVPVSQLSYARPPRRTYAEMKPEMESYGLCNVDGPWRTFTGQTKHKLRTTCDTCYVRAKFQHEVRAEAGKVLCAQKELDGVLINNCTNCWAAGRPCSWTSDSAFDAPDRRVLRAVGMKPLIAPTVTEISREEYKFD